MLDQCAFENINICGMIQSQTDEADWEHLLGAAGSEDHTLLGRCRGQRSPSDLAAALTANMINYERTFRVKVCSHVFNIIHVS